MLDGVTPFPREFAARYAERGNWPGRPSVMDLVFHANAERVLGL